MKMNEKMKTHDGFEVSAGFDGTHYTLRVADDDTFYMTEKDWNKFLDLCGRVSANGGQN